MVNSREIEERDRRVKAQDNTLQTSAYKARSGKTASVAFAKKLKK